MRTRLELHEILCTILGSRNVYFQPSKKATMKYPAIVYSRCNIDNRHANDRVYRSQNQYQITVIDANPDSPTIDAVNQLQSADFVRTYISDNLNHTVFQLYF